MGASPLNPCHESSAVAGSPAPARCHRTAAAARTKRDFEAC
jgi:hypothetical protein